MTDQEADWEADEESGKCSCGQVSKTMYVKTHGDNHL